MIALKKEEGEMSRSTRSGVKDVGWTCASVTRLIFFVNEIGEKVVLKSIIYTLNRISYAFKRI